MQGTGRIYGRFFECSSQTDCNNMPKDKQFWTFNIRNYDQNVSIHWRPIFERELQQTSVLIAQLSKFEYQLNVGLIHDKLWTSAYIGMFPSRHL